MRRTLSQGGLAQLRVCGRLYTQCVGRCLLTKENLQAVPFGSPLQILTAVTVRVNDERLGWVWFDSAGKPIPAPCQYEGRTVPHGDWWQVNPCKFCECSNGIVSCASETCPLLTCPNSAKVPGQCCRVCIGEWSVFLCATFL